MSAVKASTAARFTLAIELGNDAMETRAHVARALRGVAQRVSAGETEGAIQDVNGNTVGRWGFE